MKLTFKDIDIKKTIICNFGYMILPITSITYLVIIMNAYRSIQVDEVLKLPFILIICLSFIMLLSFNKVTIKVVNKNDEFLDFNM